MSVWMAHACSPKRALPGLAVWIDSVHPDIRQDGDPAGPGNRLGMLLAQQPGSAGDNRHPAGQVK
jgi:hypothetical protein